MRHLPVVGGLFRDTLPGRVQRHEYEQGGGGGGMPKAGLGHFGKLF